MPEGLTPSEVGKGIAEHATTRDEHAAHERRDDWIISAVEAVLLAVVAVLAAWSGFAAAKWGTESSINLSKASARRVEANEANLVAMETRNFDASTFNTWFSAYVAGNASAASVAERRFRPEFKVAFDAWIATDPANNLNAPPGPTYMPEYKQPEADRSEALRAEADTLFEEGSTAGRHSDDYVRITVVMAAVLFLVGISGHFRFPRLRYALVAVSSCILLAAAVLLVTAASPP